MNKSILTKGTKLLALAAGIVLYSSTASAQNLINESTGTINNVATGQICFTDNDAEFENDAVIGNITNNGEIHIFGNDMDFTGDVILTSADALRIPGYVSYRSPAGTQNVHEGYYTDVDVQDASTKSFNGGPAEYYIGGNYTTAGGNREYVSSTVTYDGTTGTQEVAAENNGNSSNTNAGGGYYNVAFDGGAIKNIDNGQTIAGNTTTLLGTGAPQGGATGGVSVNNDADNATSYTANGVFTQFDGAGDFTMSSTSATNAIVQMLADGNIIDATTQANAGGALVLGDGTNPLNTTVNTNGNLNLADAANATLDVTGAALLNVNGGFANLQQARTNQTFAGTSTVNYQDGAGNVVSTASTNPYGNLTLSKANGNLAAVNNGGTENDINVATNFTMNGGNGNDLDMTATTGALTMLTDGSTITYANQEEVIGRFRHGFELSDATTYIFNNAATTVDVTDNGSGMTYFEMLVNKGATNNNYVALTDVARQIEIDYDGANDWTADVTAAYLPADITGFGPGNTEAQIKFNEGETAAANVERVFAGAAPGYTRAPGATGANSFSTVELHGMTGTATAIDGVGDNGFFAANELILRAGESAKETFAHGRWSNPASWVDFDKPTPGDEAIIRHNIHVGFTRTGVDNYTDDELTPNQLASKITLITPVAATGNADVALIFGSEELPAGQKWATANGITTGLNGEIIIEDDAVATNIPDMTLGDRQPALASGGDVNYTGLIVLPKDATGTATAPVPELMSRGDITNFGPINVGGILCLGQ